MASPQKEHGYTAIANEIMEALFRTNLTGQEFRITLLILRKTYGFQKCEDVVSLSQMCSETGIHRIRCSLVVKRLVLMQILTVTENINGVSKKYKFNKDFEKWKTVNVDVNRYCRDESTVVVDVNNKRNITKENINYQLSGVIVDINTPPPATPKPKAPRVEYRDGKIIIPEHIMLKLKKVSPGVDYTQEVIKAELWLMNNPTKIRSNYGSFISRWFIRAQDNFVKYGGKNEKSYANRGTYRSPRDQELDTEIEKINREYYARKNAPGHSDTSPD